jgi:4-hydroxybenzoate polyprenyltransferase
VKPIRPEFEPSSTSKLLSYLRLMRLPNVFTAVADIAMGFLLVHDLREPLPLAPFLLLIGASALIYTAGMILNDVFDYQVDLQERPHRPLPSGEISLGVAMRIGMLFLFNGVMLAAAAGWMHEEKAAAPFRSGLVAGFLALAVIAYDAWLKKTPLGPIAMGVCRLLNVLLGMSAAGIATPAEQTFLTYHMSHWLVAAGIGIYITGVTWFARSEATESSRGQLTMATAVMISGIVLLALLPHTDVPGKPLVRPPMISYLLFALLAMPIVRRAVVAIQDPQPANVQGVVKHCILSLIILDAGVTLITSGPIPGLLVALLALPMFVLGRWVYST